MKKSESQYKPNEYKTQCDNNVIVYVNSRLREKRNKIKTNSNNIKPKNKNPAHHNIQHIINNYNGIVLQYAFTEIIGPTFSLYSLNYRICILLILLFYLKMGFFLSRVFAVYLTAIFTCINLVLVFVKLVLQAIRKIFFSIMVNICTVDIVRYLMNE